MTEQGKTKTSTRLLLWIAVLGFILFIATAAAVALILAFDDGFSSSEPSVLAITLEGDLPDAPQQGAFIFDEADFPPLLTEVAQAIRMAADDEEIEGLLLEIKPVSLGLAGVQELSAALQYFVASGKPCTAHADILTNKEYLLAASCGEIHLAPAGIVMVNGLSINQTYFRGTLDKVGVRANFAHVGDYKSAVEPYERDAPSEAADQATHALLDSLYTQFASLIANGRGMEIERVMALIDDPPMTPQGALDSGMVDALSFRDEVMEGAGDEDPMGLGSYLKKLRRVNKERPRVAVIHAEGSIVSGEGGSGMFGGSYVGDESLIELIQQAHEDDDVVAVVLRVNSPGGSGLASDNIWNAIQSMREDKPVVVSMGDLAASGGYYISMGSDLIVAQPGTLTGSIGVFGGKMNLRGLYEKLGMTIHGYKRGSMADLFSPVDDFSEEGRARFQQFLQSFYDLFISRAAQGRDMTPEAVHSVAQGRVWTGSQALDRGLVDDLGGLHKAIAHARDLAKVTEETGILRLPAQRTLLDELMEDLSSEPISDAAAAARALKLIGGSVTVMSAAERLARTLDGDTGVLAMLPYAIEVR